MAQMIREVMTPDPIVLDTSNTAADAARVMRDKDIGPVIVLDNDKVSGIVTDRDIVVRVVAQGKNPEETRLSEFASLDLVTLNPDQAVGDAVRIMREKAIRRLPVVEDGKPVGIVSIGDLAVERDSESALADISAAEPNK